MSYNRSSDGSDSWWTIGGVALLLVGLLFGAILWQDGRQALGMVLLLAGVLGGPIVIGLFSRE
jgi:MYXO-CTERM domain-containing protein